MLRASQATLLLLFVHGFKGHDHHTFLDFPNRIRTILTNANLQLDVEAIAYPQYDTRGDFNVAVNNFVEWVDMTVRDRQEFNAITHARDQKEAAIPNSTSKPAPVYVVLLGHSMGGLVAADAALQFHARSEPSPVIGLLAYDTPYLGLNHTIFTQAAYERASTMAKKAADAYSLVSSYLPAAAAAGASAWSSISPPSTSPAPTGSNGATREDQRSRTLIGSSSSPNSNNNNSGSGSSGGWTSFMTTKKETTSTTSGSTKKSSWGWGSVALGVGAVVAASAVAVVANKHVTQGMEWVTSHVQFVGTLWNQDTLYQRLCKILCLPLDFHCFYTQVKIPASASNNFRSEERTFIELTAIPEKVRPYFSARNCSGQDEIEAHTQMFNPTKNFDYYSMGDETVKKIRVMVDKALKRNNLTSV